MKDELSMKPPVSAIDGSRFATSLASDKTVSASQTSPSGVASRVLPARFAVSLPEESMVVDDRSHLTPAQMVETS